MNQPNPTTKDLTEYEKMNQTITQHALDRFMERSGSNRVMRSLNKLSAVVDSAIPIGKNKLYWGGWIIVMVKGEVKTAYHPRTRKQMNQVHAACRRHKLHGTNKLSANTTLE